MAFEKTNEEANRLRILHHCLGDLEMRIIYLLIRENYNFNRLCRALGHVARASVKKSLDRLMEMQLVGKKEVRGRGGQLHVYFLLSETTIKLEERISRLDMEWKELSNLLQRLGQFLKRGKLEPEKAGSILADLFCKAIHTESIARALGRRFPMKFQQRLLSYSISKFNSFLGESMRFTKEHPETFGGFKKTVSGFGEVLDRACKSMEDKLKEVEGRISEYRNFLMGTDK